MWLFRKRQKKKIVQIQIVFQPIFHLRLTLVSYAANPKAMYFSTSIFNNVKLITTRKEFAVVAASFLLYGYAQLLIHIGASRLAAWHTHEQARQQKYIEQFMPAEQPLADDATEDDQPHNLNPDPMREASESDSQVFPSTFLSFAARSQVEYKLTNRPCFFFFSLVSTETLVSCVNYGTPALKTNAHRLLVKKFLADEIAVNLLVLDLKSRDMDRRLKAIETLHGIARKFQGIQILFLFP